MTRQIIFTGSQANDGTGDTLRDGAAKINANFQEIYETFGPDGLVIGTQINFDSASINFRDITLTYETNLSAVGPTQDRFIRLPDYSAFVVLDSASQTLTNKTLDSCSYGALMINDISADHQYQILPSELTGNRTARLPVLSADDTFVFVDQSQTLSNKTLDSATINNAIIPDGTWQDANGNEILGFVSQGSAVDYLTINNATASNPVDITADGESTDINIRILPKGAGSIELHKRVMFGDGQRFDITNVGPAALEADQPALFFNMATTGSYTLVDGDEKGQVIFLTNKSASVNAGFTQTGSNFAQGTSFTLPPLTVAQLMWDGSAWYVINKSDVTITP